MIAKWKARVDLEWLKERQQYLTASDIKMLIPFTASGKRRSIEDKYLEVWTAKQEILDEDDCISYGAAARGHWLERYAIEEYNNFAERDNFVYQARMYHWDNVIITDRSGQLGYSPDALSIPSWTTAARTITNTNITELSEIKCYGTSKHYRIAQTPRIILEERWQIATAMTVSPSLECGNLILYNPKANNKLFVKKYLRRDLMYEIEIIRSIVSDYYIKTAEFKTSFDRASYPAIKNEEELKEIYEAEILSIINPQGG